MGTMGRPCSNALEAIKASSFTHHKRFYLLFISHEFIYYIIFFLSIHQSPNNTDPKMLSMVVSVHHRDAGGAMGKRGAAKEEEYFHNLVCVGVIWAIIVSNIKR